MRKQDTTTNLDIAATPGPWKAECEDRRSWTVRSEDYGAVALVHDPYADNFARQAQLGANARLIAAAPELFAALKAMLSAYDVPRACCVEAHDAIAKAEGR